MDCLYKSISFCIFVLYYVIVTMVESMLIPEMTDVVVHNEDGIWVLQC